MVVYADVLIAVNIIVDYFLLKLTAKFLDKTPSLVRMVLGAVLGGIFSLWIFVPDVSALLQTAVHIIMCIIMVFAVFGYINFKTFVRCSATFIGVSFFYAGGMFGFWYAFRPNGMVINNSVVYFNVSPLFLIAFSVAGYFVSALIRSLFRRESDLAEKCEAEIFLGDTSIKITALIDTGNSLSDPFGTGEIIIIDQTFAEKLLKGTADLKTRYRAIPCNTVLGCEMLDGYRCDKACITYKNRRVEIRRVIVAISKTPLKDGADAIVNPRTVG